ncbi:hypothetical protein [Actinophytocola sp.]|uniref:hypothetical protein n=1 Tax=Actinophytocola sp. TaxID=1872138 RepID=UPI0025BBD38E|nr:hypothetical protein [Actinophytocola sp.]
MSTLGWVIVAGVAMTVLALSGSIALLLPDRIFNKIVLPLVALAAWRGPGLGPDRGRQLDFGPSERFVRLPDRVLNALGIATVVYGTWLLIAIANQN